MTPGQRENLRVIGDSLEPLVEEVGGPLGLLGRAFGMGQAEIKAGIPQWAWLGVGLVGGALAAYTFRHKLEALLDS